MRNLKYYITIRESLTMEKKKELLIGLKTLKQKIERENVNLSPMEPMNLEEDSPSLEKSVIAKSFPTSGNFNAVINKNRGIQFAPKEVDAIRRFEEFATPTTIDPFMVRYETSDMFANNTRVVIKKHQDGSQFSFAAYISSKNTGPDSEDGEEAPPQDKMQKSMPSPDKQKPMAQKPPAPGKPPAPTPSKPSRSSMPTLKELATSGSDNIIIKKSVTFQDDIKGADILADFLRELDL